MWWCLRHCSIRTWATAAVLNVSHARSSLRNLSLKLAPYPFFHELPGSIYAGLALRVVIYDLTVVAIINDALLE